MSRLRRALVDRFGSERAAFDALDADGDGNLSYGEVEVACEDNELDLRAATGVNDLGKLFRELDVDREGNLSFYELFETTADMRNDPVVKLRAFLIAHFGSEKKAFAELDTNRGGGISLGEIRDSFQRLGLRLSEAVGGADLKQIFKELDIDESGELSFQELFKTTYVQRKDPAARRAFAAVKEDKLAAAQEEGGLFENEEPVEKLRRYMVERFGSGKKAFAALDSKGRGEVTYIDFEGALRGLGVNVRGVTGGTDLLKIFRELDIDAGGSLSFFEVFKTTAKMRHDPVIRFRRFLVDRFRTEKLAFKVLDRNGNGGLSRSEVLDAFSRLGLSMNDATGGADFRTVFRMMDIDSTGELNFKELFQTTFEMRSDPVVRLRAALLERYGTMKDAFAKIDADENGHVSYMELTAALGSLHIDAELVCGVDLRTVYSMLDVHGVEDLSEYELFVCSYEEREKERKTSDTLAAAQEGMTLPNEEVDVIDEFEGGRRGRRNAIANTMSHYLTEMKLEEMDLQAFPKIAAFAEDVNQADLDLQFNCVGKLVAQVLAYAMGKPGASASPPLPADRKMRMLNLESNYMCSIGILRLLPAIETHCSLQCLLLAWNGISDRGATRLATLVRRSPALTYLDVSHNRIGDEGAERFYMALTRAAATEEGIVLRTLNLKSNAIGQKGATLLLKGCGNVVKLVLQSNNAAFPLCVDKHAWIGGNIGHHPLGPVAAHECRRTSLSNANSSKASKSKAGVVTRSRSHSKSNSELPRSPWALPPSGDPADFVNNAFDYEFWPPAVQLRKALLEAALPQEAKSRGRPSSPGSQGSLGSPKLLKLGGPKRRTSMPSL